MNKNFKYLNKIIEIAGPVKVSMSVLINSYISNINGPSILISIPNIVQKCIYTVLNTIFKFNFEDRVLKEHNNNIISVTCQRRQKFISKLTNYPYGIV